MHEHEFDYEQLTNVQFQGLVGALVVREHPRVQCMPLSGRDGGRDVIVQTLSPVSGKMTDSIIYQVKMRQRSTTGVPTRDDLYDWAVRQINAERTKIGKLIKRGAREYIFVCNIPASGDLDAGLRDQIQEFLQKKISIPSTVWWREDIDTRLRAYSDVAASHGLLTGNGSLAGICRNCHGDGGSSQATIGLADFDLAMKAVASYCADQYREDRVMRFSQADLDPVDLIDLFVDVPLVAVRTTPASETSHQWSSLLRSLRTAYEEMSLTDDSPLELYGYHNLHDVTVRPGAADLLLISGSTLRRALIEGAPGQGKSTTTQYICQVHRARLLGKERDLARMNRLHRYCHTRIPFRVELRRYASWIREIDDRDRCGIISYISDMVRRASELEFSTAHLTSILCSSPTLIVLDGLDEVADVDTRTFVIEKINRLNSSLLAWKSDASVIVTSRPSVFATEEVLSEQEFPRFVLDDLQSQRIFKYAETWMNVKNASAEKREEIRDVLGSSLERPHVADLARNPMQLAILLYLVFTRGKSLPEKRTALYHLYIETYQSRESHKSLPVNKYGDLLLDLHGYLAWILHCRAEIVHRGSGNGDIDKVELESVVASYLEFEGYESGLAAQILDGVQRFFLLVERIEGRFEFEVQPLREFFAARHLYTTSPQAPSVDEPAGTRPERLEALLVNPYWLNVLRFFVGHYQKGELADLSRRLADLVEGPSWGNSSQSYETIYCILQDYSMSQSRRDTGDVAKVLSGPLGQRLIAHGFYTAPYARLKSAGFIDDSGRRQIAERVRATLASFPADGVARELATVLGHNDTGNAEWWYSQWVQEDHSDADFQRFLCRVGTLTGAIAELPIEDAKDVFASSSPLGTELWIRCIENGRDDIAVLDGDRFEQVRFQLANGPLSLSGVIEANNWLADLADCLTTQGMRSLRYGFAFSDFGDERPREEVSELADAVDVTDLVSLTEFLLQMRKKRHRSQKDWHLRVGRIENVLGDSWTGWRAAFFSGFDGDDGNSVDRNHLLDSTVPKWERLASALANRSSGSYWVELMSDSSLTHPESYAVKMATATAFLAWVDGNIVPECVGPITAWWEQLCSRDMAEIRQFMHTSGIHGLSRLRKRDLLIDLTELGDLSKITPSLLVFLAGRMNSANRRKVLRHLTLNTRVGSDDFVDGEISEALVGAFIRKPSIELLDHIASRFAAARYSGRILMGTNAQKYPAAGIIRRFPLDLAETILAAPFAYPWTLVSFANQVSLSHSVKKVTPLRYVANQACWFRHDVDASLGDSTG